MPTCRLISVAEAADRLAVSQRHIRRAIWRGDLAARRVGGRIIRIDPADLDRWATRIPTGGAA